MAKAARKKSSRKKSAKRKSAKRKPAKRKSGKRKSVVRKSPKRKSRRRRAPKPKTPTPAPAQGEPWPVLFAVVAALAMLLVAAWLFRDAAVAADIGTGPVVLWQSVALAALAGVRLLPIPRRTARR